MLWRHRNRWSGHLACRCNAVLVAVALVASVCCSACSDSSGGDDQPAGGGKDAGLPDVSVESGVDAADTGADVKDGSSEATSEASTDTGVDPSHDVKVPVDPAAWKYLPKGWMPWTGWSEQCPLWYPPEGSKAEIPKVTWKPCSKKIPLPTGVVCEQVQGVLDSPPPFHDVIGRLFQEASTGRWKIAYREAVHDPAHPNILPNLQAFVDLESGEVQVGFMELTNRDLGCWVYPQTSVGTDRWLFRIAGDTWTEGYPRPETYQAGLLSGHFPKRLPDIVRKKKYLYGKMPYLFGGRDWYIAGQVPVTRAHWWDESRVEIVYPADDSAADQWSGDPIIAGDDVFQEEGYIGTYGVYTWNAKDGGRRLLRWPGVKRYAGNFGTDGHDMVWTYVEGDNDQLDGTDTTWVMTAPYETDAAKLWSKARKLHRDWTGIGTHAWKVGCGYAAQYTDYSDLIIVRLADGRWWKIPVGAMENVESRLMFGPVVGMTCDAVYDQASIYNGEVMLRIRYDSLGPGHPASE